MNWDTIKLFLALARDGSARVVAQKLGLSASTVTRRISDLEEQLDTKLFNRFSSGFKLTEAGHDLLQVAFRMENDAFEIERKLQAKKNVMRGLIRITVPSHFMTPVFLNAIKQFADINPGVDVEILPSWEPFKLERGEADIALRVMQKNALPQEDLIGVKIANIHHCIYCSEGYLANRDLTDPGQAYFIGWDDESRKPAWVEESKYSHLLTQHRLNDPLMQVYAAKVGLGLTMLPCFLCDGEEGLVRTPNTETWHRFDLWMLSHPDLRDTSRFREMRAHLKQYFQQTANIWEGVLT